MRSWTNEEAIQRWAEFPREILDAMEPDGDFGRRHLLNPALLRMPGEAAEPLGIRYVQADLCRLPSLGGPFDAAAGSGAEAYVHLPNFLVVAARRAFPQNA